MRSPRGPKGTTPGRHEVFGLTPFQHQMDRKGACRGWEWQRLQTCPDTALLTPRIGLWGHLVEHVSINLKKYISVPMVP